MAATKNLKEFWVWISENDIISTSMATVFRSVYNSFFPLCVLTTINVFVTKGPIWMHCESGEKKGCFWQSEVV